MNANLDELYFRWLYSQVASVKYTAPSRTFWNLFRIFFEKEFVYLVANDDNRAADGRDLRQEFLDFEDIIPRDSRWAQQSCNMLELFVSLARTLAFETSTDTPEWFWEMLENLDLNMYNDRSNIPRHRVEHILDRVIWRTYDYDGQGGLFPLINPERDQRRVELWYQLNAYILERGYV